MMSSIDTVDTSKQGVEQHRKRECLKGARSKEKMYLLPGKKQQKRDRVDKTSNETIYKVHAENKQHQLNEKGEKSGKVLGKQ